MSRIFSSDVSLFLGEQLVELVQKGVDILELAVNGCEAHIADLVDGFQLLHRKLADLHGRDLTVEHTLDFRFDAVDHLLDLLERDGTLFAGSQNTCGELVAVKNLAGLVALDHNDGNGFDHLMRREALAAFQALPAAADTLAVIRGT